MFQKHCSDDRLLAFLDGELDAASARAVAQHLTTCWSCRARQQAMETAAQKLAQSLSQVDYPEESWLPNARQRLDNSIDEYEGAPLAVAPRRNWWRWALIPAACAAAAATVFISVRPPAPPSPPHKAAARPVISAPLQPPAPLPRPAPVVKSPIETALIDTPTSGELLEAEVQAEYALHRSGACLGEQVEVARADQRIAVRGIVETEERRSALRAILGDTPYLDFEVAAAESIPPTAVAALPAPQAVVQPVELPLRRLLEERLHNPQAIAAFANSAVALSSSVRAEAWALRRLEEKYPAAVARSLDGAARWLYDDMRRDHAAALARQSAALVALLEPVFGKPDPGAAPDSVAALAAAAEDIDELVRALLAGGSLVGDPAEAVRTLLARAGETASAASQMEPKEVRK